MHPAFWGEFAGTAVLILLGNGVVACVVLKKSYGHGSGWMVITAGWCFAVLAGVITALAVGSHAHLSPAVPIGLAIASGAWSARPAYNRRQLLCSKLCTTLVRLHY